MKNITLDQFFDNPQEITVNAAIGEESYRISIPGATAAVLISEQEYEALTSKKQ